MEEPILNEMEDPILNEMEPGEALGEVHDPRQILSRILEIMGFEAEVSLTEDDERVLLEITGSEASVLIGKKGQTLDALQFLLGKIVHRDREGRKPILVDIGGYRERRIQALEQLAQRLSEEATRTGKIVAVNPMSAHDRRVIHMALKEDPGVSTRSEGEGLYRRLLIVPEQER